MKIGLFLLCFFLVLSLSFSKTDNEAILDSEPITLKMGHFANEGHAGNVASQLFAEAVEKRTKGKIKILIYPNNQLGTPPDVLEQNILGAIDMSLPSQGQLAKYSKKFGCVMLPFVFNGYQQAYRTLDGPFIQWAGPDIEAQGLVFLSNWEWGFRNITNNVRPINTPDDLKGLKIRTPPELANQLSMEAFGAIVQTIAWPELPMALKQRVVDGQENPVSVIHAFKIYETQKYMTMTGHTYNSMVHVISKRTWDRLTINQQTIIKEESVIAGNYMRQVLQDAESELLNQLEELGMEIIYPDIEKFKVMMGPTYKKMEEILGSKNVKTFLNMVVE
ncbi:MAG: TRAP transporter substrate-binding protein [Spirochaetaceae bacterium]